DVCSSDLSGDQEIIIKESGFNSILVRLLPQADNLDEVVVTAIGIMQQKRKIGYATQEVKAEVLQQSKTMNVGSTLSGQVAGLIVNNPTGIFQAPTFSLRSEERRVGTESRS